MNAILEEVPDAPLLNVLLVQSDSGLPGSGAVGYLASRYPDLRWLRRDNAHRDTRWRELVEYEAAHVYEYDRWNEVYRIVYGRRLPAAEENLTGKERDGTGRGGGEGVNHKALRLKVTRAPSLVRRGLRPESTETEVELLSGDRVDVVSVAKDGTIAIEVKSRDSNWNDLRRGRVPVRQVSGGDRGSGRPPKTDGRELAGHGDEAPWRTSGACPPSRRADQSDPA